jgi:hypothetical protein
LWWAIYRTANIGIATGSVSKLTVLDFDYDAQVKYKEALPIIESHTKSFIVSQTGKGYHVWLKGNGIGNTIVARSEDRKRYIETRGDGGYIVAPPSIHPTRKNKYELIKGTVEDFNNYESLTTERIKEILLVLKNHFNEQKDDVVYNSENRNGDASITVETRVTFINAIIRKQIERVKSATSGERNLVLFQAAAELGKFGNYIDEHAIYDLLLRASEENRYVQDDGRGHALKTITSGLKRAERKIVIEDPFCRILQK